MRSGNEHDHFNIPGGSESSEYMCYQSLKEPQRFAVRGCVIGCSFQFHGTAMEAVCPNTGFRR